jgi:hypothetical protein
MSVGNLRKFEEPMQARAPVRNGGFKLTCTRPKPMVPARHRNASQRVAPNKKECSGTRWNCADGIGWSFAQQLK